MASSRTTNRFNHIVLGAPKTCCNCRVPSSNGSYVKLSNNQGRQRWGCDSCTNKGFIPKEIK